MRSYRLSGQDFHYPFQIRDIEPFAINAGTADQAAPFVPYSFLKNESGAVEPLALVSKTVGWVANAQRSVETWSIPTGFILRVEGGSDFYISADGQKIESANQNNEMMNETDRQILLGPVLVLALALRGIWCLHASAVMFKEKTVIFLGESGEGKSTLAAYLSREPDWRLVADDILPVTTDANKVQILPRFPQLKLSPDSQPCIGLPENLPLENVWILKRAKAEEMPELQAITTAHGVQVLLRHIAGTRMFDSTLLARHLEFCAKVAKHISFYELTYPHRKGVLPEIQKLLQSLS